MLWRWDLKANEEDVCIGMGLKIRIEVNFIVSFLLDSHDNLITSVFRSCGISH